MVDCLQGQMQDLYAEPANYAFKVISAICPRSYTANLMANSGAWEC